MNSTRPTQANTKNRTAGCNCGDCRCVECRCAGNGACACPTRNKAR